MPNFTVCGKCGYLIVNPSIPCPSCGTEVEIPAPAVPPPPSPDYVPHRSPIQHDNDASQTIRIGQVDIDKRRFYTSLGIVAFLFVAFLFGRVYYGEGIFRITAKSAPGFKDTFVNLSDIFGMPRIVVATQHPQVKRQLEEMGIIQTDEDVVQEARREIQKEIEVSTREWQREYGKAMKDAQREQEKMMREWEREMRKYQ